MKKKTSKIKNLVPHKRYATIGGIIAVIFTVLLITRVIYINFSTEGEAGGYSISHIILIFFSFIAPAVVLHLYKTVPYKIINSFALLYPIALLIFITLGVVMDFHSVIESGFVKKYGVPFCGMFAVVFAALLFVQIISVSDEEEEG